MGLSLLWQSLVQFSYDLITFPKIENKENPSFVTEGAQVEKCRPTPCLVL